jgi:anti-sigma regulatory factor (Ser/Thr protein kinase)/biotin operon repressor
MTAAVRGRTEDIRRFILEHVEAHPDDISKITAEKFAITRQAVNKHMTRLRSEGVLSETGNTRNRAYKLAALSEWTGVYEIRPNLAEDRVWSSDIRPNLGELPHNVMNIWHHGFTEMFNNAIDHSEGTAIRVTIARTAIATEMSIGDNGIGIFQKIQRALNLLDARHALLELSKGKLTTDPKRHSGEGIFFTSRMFDSFDIHSAEIMYSHEFGKAEDWLLEFPTVSGPGTLVLLKLNNHTARTTTRVFDQFAFGEDYGFNKTVVPVRLAQYGNDQLISRSQAKRLLARVELFKVVMFDFRDVPAIGQAFADEIFRVFATSHPNIELHPLHASSEVKRMIERVTAGAEAPHGAGQGQKGGVPPS